MGTPVSPPIVRPLGMRKYTLTSSALGLANDDASAGIPDGASRCTVVVENYDIRVRDDGTNPDASTGQLWKKDTGIIPYEGDLSTLKMFPTTSGAVVFALFYSDRSISAIR